MWDDVFIVIFERSELPESSASTGTKFTHPEFRHSAFLQSMKTNF